MVYAVYLSVLATLITAAIYLYIGSKDARNLASASDYLLYRHRLEPGQVFGTFYASGMSLATVFIAFMQLAPFLGTKLIWSVIFYSLGHVVLWLLIGKILENAHGVTLHGFLGKKYKSNILRYTASITTTIGFLGVFATELIVGTFIFSALFKTQSGYWLSLTIVTSVVLAYSILGGFKSVVKTDKIQSIGIIFVSVLLVYIAWKFGKQEGVLIPKELTKSWILPPIMMLNFFLINVAFPIVDMSAWQRVIASKDRSVASKGLISAIIMFILTWSAVLFAGLGLSEFSGKDSTGGLIHDILMFGSQGWLVAIIASIGFASLVAAMVSTADTFLIAAGQTIAMDIRDREFFDESEIISRDELKAKSIAELNEKDHSVISRTRINMLYLSLAGLIFCVILKVIGFNVAELVFAVYGAALSLVPCVIVALFHPNHNSLSRLSSFAILSTGIGVIFGWLYGILAVLKPQDDTMLSVISHSLDIFLGHPSAYNSPTVSFGFATVIMIVGVIFYWKKEA